MEFNEERKIIPIGDSLCITLPAYWIKSSGIKAGDTLDLKIDDCGRIILEQK